MELTSKGIREDTGYEEVFEKWVVGMYCMNCFLGLPMGRNDAVFGVELMNMTMGRW